MIGRATRRRGGKPVSWLIGATAEARAYGTNDGDREKRDPLPRHRQKAAAD